MTGRTELMRSKRFARKCEAERRMRIGRSEAGFVSFEYARRSLNDINQAISRSPINLSLIRIDEDGLNNRAVQLQQHIFHEDMARSMMTFKAVKRERITISPNDISQICSVNSSVIHQSFNNHSSVIHIYLSSQSIMKNRFK